MKTKLAALALIFALAGGLRAAPISFNEVSLLVRMHETEPSITQQLSQRRLLRALTPEQEAKLKADGASESLLQTLRQPATVLPLAEAVAFETWTAEQKQALAKRLAEQAAQAEAEQAARAMALANWQQAQEEKAARERAVAQDSSLSASDYYGSYGYSSSGHPYEPGPSCAVRPAAPSFSSSSLQWSNGTTTTHTSAGLSYYPLGSNGANCPPAHSPAAPCAPAAQSPGPSGGRFGR